MKDDNSNSPKIYSDVPLDGATNFNFDIYSDVISNIVSSPQNRTPLSIAINGKWGSGKTSLMKTIRQKLDSKSKNENERQVITIWFDAWKYSDEDSIIAALVREIYFNVNKKIIEQNPKFRFKSKYYKLFWSDKLTDYIKYLILLEF